jgi:ubiquinone/menaquinone biosynthesis C-methylase UbiE
MVIGRPEGGRMAVPVSEGFTIEAGLAHRWDGRAAGWDEVAHTPAFAKFCDAILAAADIGPDAVVVDVGCGTGLVTLPAARLCRSAIGLDASATMLEHLSEHARRAGVTNISLIHGDMRRVPLADASVDVVVSCYAFHHLSDDGKELAAAEAFRVLRPGGRMVTVDMMFRISLAARDRRIVTAKVRLLLRAGPRGVVRLVRNAVRVATRRWEHPASLGWWRQTLERRGFQDVQVDPLEHEAGIARAIKPGLAPPA